MTIYLVRHAKAGDRDAWDGDDELRPLSGRGHVCRRAACSTCCADAEFERVLSSPYVRCMETVVPLAAERRMAIEPVEALAEGAASTKHSRSCASMRSTARSCALTAT